MLKRGDIKSFRSGKEFRVTEEAYKEYKSEGIKLDKIRRLEDDLKLIDSAQHQICLLGINCLGPLHQGRERLLKKLTYGVNIRILILNPNSLSFTERVWKEAGERDTKAGRLIGEFTASIGICKDMIEYRTDEWGMIEVRVYNTPPLRSMVMIDPQEKGVTNFWACNLNVYPSVSGTRGVTGTTVTYESPKNLTTQQAVHEYHKLLECKEIFENLWILGKEYSLTFDDIT